MDVVKQLKEKRDHATHHAEYLVMLYTQTLDLIKSLQRDVALWKHRAEIANMDRADAIQTIADLRAKMGETKPVPLADAKRPKGDKGDPFKDYKHADALAEEMGHSPIPTRTILACCEYPVPEVSCDNPAITKWDWGKGGTMFTCVEHDQLMTEQEEDFETIKPRGADKEAQNAQQKVADR